jgi:hypothetical protein
LRELRVARGHSLVAAGAGTPLVRDGCIHPGAAGRLVSQLPLDPRVCSCICR